MVTLDDIYGMTQSEFDALPEADRVRLAMEFADKILFETPIEKQRLIFTTLECSDMFPEFEKEFYAAKGLTAMTKVVKEWEPRLRYLKAVLDIQSGFDEILECHEEYLRSQEDAPCDDLEDYPEDY